MNYHVMTQAPCDLTEEDFERWAEMQAHARKLDAVELQRHADVCSGNGHACEATSVRERGFTCAAFLVLREREYRAARCREIGKLGGAPKSGRPHLVTIGAEVPREMVSLVDAARGKLYSRSEWVRGAIAARLAAEGVQ
jgi:hypothetical protein